MSFRVVGGCSFTLKRGKLNLKRKLWFVLTSKTFSTWTGGWHFSVHVWRCQSKHPLSEDDWESELLSRSLPATEINRPLSTRFTPRQTHDIAARLPFPYWLYSLRQAARVCRGSAKGDDAGQNEKLLQSRHQHGQRSARAHTHKHTRRLLLLQSVIIQKWYFATLGTHTVKKKK